MIERAKNELRAAYFAARSVFYRGDHFRCPVCEGRFRAFLPFGEDQVRENARCPRCGSLERHRLLFLYLRRRTNFFTAPLRTLEFAPHPYIQRRLRRQTNLTYTSADLESPLAMLTMDITDIQLADGSIDCILCYHVLEHVPDDRRAMTELFRILSPDGWAILQVPVDLSREATFEDPAVVDPRERARLFGRPDHVRVYGRDYADRLRGAGFRVSVVDFVAEIGDEAQRFALRDDEPIYFCDKPSPT